MSFELDPRCTFDSFIVGPANRLVAAAARRVAEAPGNTYNPLFLYSASGLGKTHLLMAIGNQVRRRQPDLRLLYGTLERLVGGASVTPAAAREGLRNQLRAISVLLLDDVQFIAGRHDVQTDLLLAWDGIAARGGQLVLASDRAPHEIAHLDERLLSRFAGGLVIDVPMPDCEALGALVTRTASERGQQLAPGVADTIAGAQHANVRELQGALNRVLAVQELHERIVAADEAAAMLGLQPSHRGDEFTEFVQEVAGTIEIVVGTLPAEPAAVAVRDEPVEADAVSPEAAPVPERKPDPEGPELQRPLRLNTALMSSDKVLWKWPYLESTLLLDPE
jgi:chromosomal replication initiator protein